MSRNKRFLVPQKVIYSGKGVFRLLQCSSHQDKTNVLRSIHWKALWGSRFFYGIAVKPSFYFKSVAAGYSRTESRFSADTTVMSHTSHTGVSGVIRRGGELPIIADVLSQAHMSQSCQSEAPKGPWVCQSRRWALAVGADRCILSGSRENVVLTAAGNMKSQVYRSVLISRQKNNSAKAFETFHTLLEIKITEMCLREEHL